MNHRSACLLGLILGCLPVSPVSGQQTPPPAGESPRRPYAGEMIYLRDFGTDEVGYLSVPHQQPVLGILIIPDGHGMHPGTRAFCEALAARGYMALAVDIYNGRRAENEDQAAANRRSLDVRLVRKALETGLNFFAKSPRFHMEHVALVALGDAGDLALDLCRETKNRSLIAATLVGSASVDSDRSYRQRIQRLEAAPGADPASLIPQMHDFWTSEETRKNIFQRIFD